jgi:hypothetical protein
VALLLFAAVTLREASSSVATADCSAGSVLALIDGVALARVAVNPVSIADSRRHVPPQTLFGTQTFFGTATGLYRH